ncbi:amidohydrolase family protein [Sphaerimonospora thailandensis]|uniref:Uncharacterized protein n=1 Tax=Sphaerimonospora thailandensis TaxID=795644 RepID=A0A8J3W0G9_9ACTN|nr:hypothetical protein [Sphaerimonospora thailandensis]GIH71597.1 hypothetical protein Mth01_38500 [Sphaerimonospora thailandensis]
MTRVIDRNRTFSRVAIPVIDPENVFDVAVEDGVIARVEPVSGARAAGTPELWPGYVETHAHLALPANFDDSLDDPRVTALQYLYHGVTHVVDMFGFPLVEALWEQGRAESAVPYPNLVHCGYAATSMRDNVGRTGHGVEFPAPVHMLGVEGDVEHVLAANSARGAKFLKVMFTDGTEQPGAAVRFSRLTERILAHAARTTAARGIPAVIDCNTREEVLQAYECGFRLFAHSVRDHVLSEDDWAALDGARFISTLSGLRPMIMYPRDFLADYSRAGFVETQDPANLDFVAKRTEPYGIELGCQETRTVALEVMRSNALAALEGGVLLVGTDSGNTGAFHGYSLLGELDLLLSDGAGAPGLGDALRRTATVEGRRFFEELSGRPAGGPPIAVGEPATFNLFRTNPGTALSALPETTVIDGATVDRGAIEREIRAFRTSDTTGKVTL